MQNSSEGNHPQGKPCRYHQILFRTHFNGSNDLCGRYIQSISSGQWARNVTTDPVNVKVDDDCFKPGYSDIPQLERTSDNVKNIYQLHFANKREWNKEEIAEMMRTLQERPGDTGSASVQIGIFTVRIKYLTDHMVHNKKDKSCLRRLLHLVHKRRKMLIYLRRKDFTQYHKILQQLNIRPVADQKYAYIKNKK